MTILKDRARIVFDVTSKSDKAVYRNFLVNRAWGAGGCPFELEFPYSSIPDMINDKLIRHFLKVDDNT